MIMTFRFLTHLMLRSLQCGSYYCYPHVMREQTETQRGLAIFPAYTARMCYRSFVFCFVLLGIELWGT